MTVHAVDALPRLGENQLVNTVLAHLAFETVGMVRVVTGHDCFVEDRLFADIAAVRAVGAYRGAVGEQQKVRVRRYLVSAFRALETIDMEERLARGVEHGQFHSVIEARCRIRGKMR